jgi:16S rRNA (guanine527-N7)-methyltransferase
MQRQAAGNREQQCEAAEILRRGLYLMGLESMVDAEARVRLLLYFHELKKWNRTFNLIGRKADDLQIIENHFLDSLTLLPLAVKQAEGAAVTLLDIVTGGGFPGLVLKAAWPRLAVTLVEPRRKRVSFLKQIIRLLQLEGVDLIANRIAPGRPGPIGLRQRKFDIVTSRAVADITTLVALAAPFRARKGRIIIMKGPRGDDELSSFLTGGTQSTLRLVERREWRLPFTKGQRHLLSFGEPTGSD